jgi:enterochelin esterase-like enzyme
MSDCRCSPFTVAAFLLAASCLVSSASAQSATSVDSVANSSTQSAKKQPAPFRWVNPQKLKLPGVRHATFRSSSMDIDVGYCIYIPSEYSKPRASNKRFPVVYYLHGGRPGNETKSVKLVKHMHRAIESGRVPPMIYVFVNGGPVSHYNMSGRSNAMGEDVFVKELIPHVDSVYRTINGRDGRGIEGFSQGGRGTTRIMFKYPELFGSAAPGGAGQATEKRISEENGRESDALVFAPGHNTYDRARAYAKKRSPALPILIHVGTKGFNYENNLAYMEFLDTLKISYQRLIVKDAAHSAAEIYEKRGVEIMMFHATNFWLGK